MTEHDIFEHEIEEEESLNGFAIFAIACGIGLGTVLLFAGGLWLFYI